MARNDLAVRWRRAEERDEEQDFYTLMRWIMKMDAKLSGILDRLEEDDGDEPLE